MLKCTGIVFKCSPANAGNLLNTVWLDL